MRTEKLALDKTGQDLLRYIAAKHPERAIKDFLERDEVVKDNKLSDEEYDRLIAMFARCQFVTILPCESGRYAELIQARTAAVSAVNQLDNQPPPDYWEKLRVWFRSKWWSVPVFLLIALVTVLGGFISVIETIVELLRP